MQWGLTFWQACHNLSLVPSTVSLQSPSPTLSTVLLSAPCLICHCAACPLPDLSMCHTQTLSRVLVPQVGHPALMILFGFSTLDSPSHVDDLSAFRAAFLNTLHCVSSARSNLSASTFAASMMVPTQPLFSDVHLSPSLFSFLPIFCKSPLFSC